MKNTTLSITVLILISLPLQMSWAQTKPCPPSHEKADQNLKEYLSNKEDINHLQTKRELAVNDSTYKTIRILQDEEDSKACTKLSENAPWLENFDNYSFYKSKNYYFIVMYSISNNTFEREGIAILNKEYKRLTTIFDF